MKHIAYLGLGTNLGDRRKNMTEAIERIEKSVGTVLRQSTFYETEPWGYESDNRYLNAVVCVETVLCPLCLLKATQRIELEMGRTEKYAPMEPLTSHLLPHVSIKTVPLILTSCCMTISQSTYRN